MTPRNWDPQVIADLTVPDTVDHPVDVIESLDGPADHG